MGHLAFFGKRSLMHFQQSMCPQGIKHPFDLYVKQTGHAKTPSVASSTKSVSDLCALDGGGLDGCAIEDSL